MLRATIYGRPDWEALRFEAQKRRDVERLLAEEHQSDEAWMHFGWCDACDRPSAFRCDWVSASPTTPNFRERLLCTECSLNCRLRFVVRCVRQLVASHPGRVTRGYVYEQATPLFRALKGRIAGAEFEGADYLDDELNPGTIRGGARHEDALKLSFQGECFDSLLATGVLDHVPDVGLALSEARRVLRPGGSLIATVPFHFTDASVRRCDVVDGVVRPLLPEMRWGRSVSRFGTLVFWDFGWDLLEMVRAAGFCDVHFRCVHSLEFAYFGSDMGLTLCATRA